MRFQTDLIPATLIRRYKRFLADVRLQDGQEVTAHCPNPGSMMGLKEEGTKVWLEPNTDPKKKLKFGWRLVEQAGFTCIDTSVANRVVGEALIAGSIPELCGYQAIRPEQRYGQNSRIDFLLDGATPCFVEVKSVTLMRTSGLAEFPDSVTARGAKHLGELSSVALRGDRAVQFYLVSRTDCDRVSIAQDIDLKYAAALQSAVQAGVEILCYNTIITPEGVTLGRRLAIDIPDKAT
ncbi:DNA/RNA nuclease SfsA [Nereida sp. MMG025]|uniref:DNA/RNA nuclease SfsA n=1 Tax=Nereida sp. MMG025 TaxID=2909981 RepID=UPI001F03214A|nr:DNA/RNA nuclease SfsA [Nereida sp. MMG025]MCF6444433.1 DNA/RNA nuclease SfsA [Nereida sp. MMG025]